MEHVLEFVLQISPSPQMVAASGLLEDPTEHCSPSTVQIPRYYRKKKCNKSF